MLDICAEDEYNDTYGRIRIHQALELKQPDGISVPSERAAYRFKKKIGISHIGQGENQTESPKRVKKPENPMT